MQIAISLLVEAEAVVVDEEATSLTAEQSMAVNSAAS